MHDQMIEEMNALVNAYDAADSEREHETAVQYLNIIAQKAEELRFYHEAAVQYLNFIAQKAEELRFYQYKKLE